jgi:NAD+ diphosphatase
MRNAGYMRACTDPACGAQHFPRSDPAIIVRVTHRDRCLLARQPSFRPGLHSILAGFVEPGESLEDAVRREVEEEAGLQLGAVSYVDSQPWPFPTSLMVGFAAEATGDDIHIDSREIESAGWMTRAEVHAEMQSGTLLLPSLKSIARRLIDEWLNDG